MAMNHATLTAEILAALNGAGFNTANPYSRLDDFVAIVVEKTIAHIQTTAEIQTTAGAPDGEHTGIIT
ncbi:MAG: hypothetical protein OEZ10_08670 [Gammaproteobacteria bacterium]|nr:hypothetical protein [Gammaproteobacteria bacterium]